MPRASAKKATAKPAPKKKTTKAATVEAPTIDLSAFLTGLRDLLDNVMNGVVPAAAVETEEEAAGDSDRRAELDAMKLPALRKLAISMDEFDEAQIKKADKPTIVQSILDVEADAGDEDEEDEDEDEDEEIEEDDEEEDEEDEDEDEDEEEEEELDRDELQGKNLRELKSIAVRVTESEGRAVEMSEMKGYDKDSVIDLILNEEGEEEEADEEEYDEDELLAKDDKELVAIGKEWGLSMRVKSGLTPKKKHRALVDLILNAE